MVIPHLIQVTDIERPSQAIAQLIRQAFDEERTVLWLVSGGSSIEVAVRGRQLLGPVEDGAVLLVGLIDERYGPAGHPDSNWQQLSDAGFDLSGVTPLPVLMDDWDIEQTAQAYDQLLSDLVSRVDVRIGLFGIGADGHTAGLLPHCPLLMVNDRFVGHFAAQDFQRISVTPALITALDEVVVYAVGEAKKTAVRQFLADGPIEDVPARLLKTAKNLTVYTDHREETA